MVKPGHDSASRNTGGVSDFIVGKPLHLSEGQDRALLGRKGVDEPLETRAAFRAFGLLPAIIACRFGHGFDRGIAGGEGQEAVIPAAAFAQMIQRPTHRDGM